MPCAEEGAIAGVMARVAASPRAMEMMNYQPQRGLLEHREAGAQWISRQGYDVAAERLTVCGGAHHGVLVVLTAVTRPGDHIVSDSQIGRAHVCTPVTNAHLVCRLLLEK